MLKSTSFVVILIMTILFELFPSTSSAQSSCKTLIDQIDQKIRDSCIEESYPMKDTKWFEVYGKVIKMLNVDDKDSLKCSSHLIYQKPFSPIYIGERILICDNDGYIEIDYSNVSCFLWGLAVYTKKNALGRNTLDARLEKAFAEILEY